MISLSFFARLITLPLVWVWTTILYVTIGTRFREQETFRKSYLLNFLVMSYAHLSHGMALKDFRYLDGGNSLFGILKKKEKKINPFKSIPNYGKVFTRKDTKRNIPDSAWLAKQPREVDEEETVIVHLHGGMLCHSFSSVHIFAFSNLYTLLQKQGLRPSILLVDYSLLPEGNSYPTPIIECLNVYDELVSLGYRKILLVGDSAGGYLILSLLYHLNERSKTSNVVWPSGVALISPWLDLNNAKKIKSYETNANKDVINFETLQNCGKEFFLRNEESYSLPLANINLNTSDDIWSGLPPFKEGNFLILVGKNEILRDSILEWCLEKSSLGKKYPEKIMIEQNGIHDGLFLTETFMFYMNYMTFEEWSQNYGVNALYDFTKEIMEKN
ncbi:meiotically up-regulated 180 protein [Schizosaccharomyces octosporus yFS286]|uniref:Meiotically up-regulated 180 protein n=1 Tax=Schizosaccharomyces octosporus (strain yFS286) TaxID=483514 RepID=S9Q6V7_SCHOY|nr:meiotically up-regulated 180 protein [Schizosaccharomyces octosporus yFS286]EPX75378.1 meiotically up-regulated 180 protein [Schizosaccharomyces octosporus yFS286]